MASVLTEIIPTQAFEIVQNRIGAILLEEITNQMSLQSLTDVFELYLERVEPYDKSEDVMISVAFNSGDYDGYTQQDVQGEYMYFIDIFAKGAGVGTQTPSENVRQKMFKYVGMARYILSSGKYPTLGLPPGVIGNRHIRKITFDTDYSNFGNHSNFDGAFIRFCRIIYTVRVRESQLLWEGIPLYGNDSNLRPEGTEFGTRLIFNV